MFFSKLSELLQVNNLLYFAEIAPQPRQCELLPFVDCGILLRFEYRWLILYLKDVHRDKKS